MTTAEGIVLFVVAVGSYELWARRAQQRRALDRQADLDELERQEAARAAALAAERLRWGKIITTTRSRCGKCSGVAILKTYETGNIESHCTECGHRVEV